MEMQEMQIKRKELLLLNEQTFLSYERTAAAVLVVSIALFKFFTNPIVVVLAFASLALSVYILVMGIYRFYDERRRIKAKTTWP